MSAEAMSWAKGLELAALQKLVVVMIADAANAEGVAVMTGSDLVRDVGASRSTVMKHVGLLEALGVLSRQPDYREDGGYRATVFRLPLVRETDRGPSGSSRTPPVRETDSPRGRDHSTATATSSLPSEERVRGNRILKFSLEEDPEEEIATDGQLFLNQRMKVDGKVVTAQEMRIAVVAMSEFNRLAGTRQSLGPNLTRIVGRVREHPSWDSAKFVRLLESAFRLRWWDQNGRRRNGKPLTPQVIFGSTQCFENVALDAADEKAGKTEQIEERRGKYDRSVVRDA